MIELSTIPEEDRVCIYCKFFGEQDRGASDTKCMGKFKCLNYHKDNTENFFIPDNWYLSEHFGCRACEHYGGYYDGTGECETCSRHFDDNWKRSSAL